jgi:hypothetical protein
VFERYVPDLRERVRRALCETLRGYVSRRGSVTARWLVLRALGPDADRRTGAYRAAVSVALELLGDLARLESEGRRRVAVSDVRAALERLGCTANK